MKTKIGQFLISVCIIGLFSSNSCKETKIIELINIMQNKPIDIFTGWDIWKRSDGIVFDLFENRCRILITGQNENLLCKQIFPEQDSVFLPLSEIRNREICDTINLIDFPNKVLLFRSLNVDEVKSIQEDNLIKIVKDQMNIIYSKEGRDIRNTPAYSKYSRFDNNWYYNIR